MLQHILKEWRDRRFWLLLCLSMVVLFCVYRITLTSPVFINLGTEDDERYLRNFHLGEQGEQYPFRWTRDSSYIKIPNLGSLPLEITLGADASRPEGQPLPRFSLIANGTVLADFTMKNGIWGYQFFYYPSLFALPRDLLLEVKSDTFFPSGDEHRALGILLNTVEVKPVSSPFRLFQVSLLASLIGTLSIAFGCLLLRWLGVSQKKSLACGVIVLALLGFGIGRQFIVAKVLVGFWGLLLAGYVLAILLEARGYREPLIARLVKPWSILKTWAGNLASAIRDPSQLFARLNSFWLRWRLDLLISVGLLIVAIAVRLPYLMLIPQITDESSEVRIALEIYRGERLPITGLGAFYGPLHQYLLALLFRVFGLSIYLPRLYVMVLGALTVVLTYWLTREMAGRTAGLIAAGLMTTSPMHILINSHIAWSNCTTPFFSTLALLVLYVAVQRRSGPLLALSGFLSGLALHTHPLTLVALLGMALWFLWRRDLRKWLRGPWPYLAVAFALLAYSSLIWFNAHGRLHSLAAAQRRTQFIVNHSWAIYLLGFQNLFLLLLSMVSGAIEGLEPPMESVKILAFAIYGLLLITGFLYTFRKRKGLPLAVLASTVLIMPYFNKEYRAPDQGRYIAHLLPICYLFIGVLLAGILKRAAKGWSGWAFLSSPEAVVPQLPSPSRKVWLKRVTLPAAILICLTLVIYPMSPLFVYYQHAMERHESNQLLLDIVTELRQIRNSDVPLYLDYELKYVRHAFKSTASKALAYLLTLDRTQFEVMKLSETDMSSVITNVSGWWDYPIQVMKPSDPQLPSKAILVLTGQSYLTLQQVFQLSPIIPIESEVPRSQGSYGLYRLYGRR